MHDRFKRNVHVKIALQNRLDSDNPAFVQCKTSATLDTVNVVLRRISLSPAVEGSVHPHAGY